MLGLVGGCSEPLPPEHVKAIATMQGLGGRVVYNAGGYRLNMAGSRIADEDLALLRDIRGVNAVDLRATQVTDAGIDLLIAVESLEQVELTGSRITPDGVKALKAARPTLKITP